jgi:xylulokinase
MADLLVGVDLGTSGCKATLLRASDGQLLATSSVRYEPSSPHRGWMEQDPRTWYEATVQVVRALLADVTDKGEVRCLGIAGQMRGLVLVDGRGEPVRPAILWNDNRCTAEVSAISGADLELLRSTTRNVLNTMCTLPKLLWLARHEAASLRAGTHMLYPKDYVRLRLTGRRATDLSDAAGSSLFDVAAQAWSTELLDRFAIDPSLLPEVGVATDVAGGLLADSAGDLGLRPGTPVIMGGSDSAVETFSIGLSGPDSCKIRLGTSGAVSTVIDGLGDTGRAYVWSFVRPDRWMLDTNTRACAGAVAWCRELLYAQIASDHEAYDAMDEEASRVPAGADGLLFHPYLLGEDAPYWDPSLRAAFSGLRIDHRRPHFARAIFEGTALALRDAMSTLGPWVRDFERYVFIGGGTASPTWLRIVADVLGVDGEVPETADASLGAAMLAGVGSAVFGDLRACVERCYRIRHRVRHDPERTRRYDELFERYLRDRPRSEHTGDTLRGDAARRSEITQ